MFCVLINFQTEISNIVENMGWSEKELIELLFPNELICYEESNSNKSAVGGKCVGNREDYNTIKEMDDWIKCSDCGYAKVDKVWKSFD